jgi:hypothetical protein
VTGTAKRLWSSATSPDQNMVDVLAPPALAATKLAAGKRPAKAGFLVHPHVRVDFLLGTTAEVVRPLLP